jgi:hypothetical protein
LADVHDTILEQRSWLERLAQKIPGFRGYYARENRREADRALREFGVARLENVVAALHDAIKHGPLEQAHEVRDVITLVEKLRNQLRYADQGYAGFFSELKWDREELLDALYRADEQIVEWASELAVSVEAGERAPADLRRQVRALERALDERREQVLALASGAEE